MQETSVEWLGEIPAHWEIAPLYARYEVQLGKMLDTKRSAANKPLPTRNVDVQWGSINVENLPVMDFSPSDTQRFALKVGDLLVCEGGEVGRAAIWHGQLADCYYQKALHRVRPRRSDQEPRFLFFALHAAAHRGVFVAGSNPNTIDHLTAEKLRVHRFPFPSPAAQRAIADFLDRKTAAIDALTHKKERLIELLQEKRLALITQAVTKGLDPTVPMKNSAIEWLGEIPAHWEIKPIGYHVDLFGGGTPSKAEPRFWDGGVPWVSPKDMKSWTISDSEDHGRRGRHWHCAEMIGPRAVLIVVRG
jgi:type I restriction enzyme S subunit